jgi:hypothetical protein
MASGVLVNNTAPAAAPTLATASPAIAPTTTSTLPAVTSATTPIIIQMPSFQYPYSSLNQLDTPTITNHKLPSISKFLFSLDQKYNCDGVYSKFEKAFLEEITVNAIKDLSDEQMQALGIVKIGWQKNIRQAAQRY